ncbi:hypothetical protein BLNAU_12354 [Blattamonas nauphoetae]|uniref:Uncharacterized protein n=1 Tax=Blattamonas nauphoetae TaxID=2049346 RepID=A0ABQ9XR77_9EUKA|nr:hypothetical protein BLNAU_12354 [Blattamonas nauphoetae]
MGNLTKKVDTSSGSDSSDLSSPQFPFSIYCSPFLNWNEEDLPVDEKATVFRSLVDTVKLQPAFDDSLEAKTVKFLKSVIPQNSKSADDFLNYLVTFSFATLTEFVQSMMLLISTPSQAIIKSAMKMLNALLGRCSTRVGLALVKADLIPQLIRTLNPQSLSFAEAIDIHIYVLAIISQPFRLATRSGLARLGIEDGNRRQAVHKTGFKQVLAPSETYFWHLCLNRFSIIEGDLASGFMICLARLLRISPSYQPTMDFVMNMPVFLTIPSCLTFFEDDDSIWCFLVDIIDAQQEWNRTWGEVRQMWMKTQPMLRSEGIEDAIEEKLRNDKNARSGRRIVAFSIKWSNLQGINLPRRR